MGIKSITLAAVRKIAVALGDSAIDLTLRKRTKADYVPGSPQSYTTADKSVKGVITKYRQEEVDGIQILAVDLLVVMWPPVDKAIPEANDVVVNGTKILGRIIANTPVYIGSEIALNLVQVRPPV